MLRKQQQLTVRRCELLLGAAQRAAENNCNVFDSRRDSRAPAATLIRLLQILQSLLAAVIRVERNAHDAAAAEFCRDHSTQSFTATYRAGRSSSVTSPLL